MNVKKPLKLIQVLRREICIFYLDMSWKDFESENHESEKNSQIVVKKLKCNHTEKFLWTVKSETMNEGRIRGMIFFLPKIQRITKRHMKTSFFASLVSCQLPLDLTSLKITCKKMFRGCNQGLTKRKGVLFTYMSK